SYFAPVFRQSRSGSLTHRPGRSLNADWPNAVSFPILIPNVAEREQREVAECVREFEHVGWPRAKYTGRSVPTRASRYSGGESFVAVAVASGAPAPSCASTVHW